MSSVTPISAGAGTEQPPSGPHPPRRQYLRLCESDDSEGFTTLDLVNGLHGVCCAIDQEAASNGCQDTNYVARLSMAAKVLSSIVASRVDL